MSIKKFLDSLRKIKAAIPYASLLAYKTAAKYNALIKALRRVNKHVYRSKDVLSQKYTARKAMI